MKMYTVWNTLTNARQINHGSRIDLILFSDEKWYKEYLMLIYGHF